MCLCLCLSLSLRLRVTHDVDAGALLPVVRHTTVSIGDGLGEQRAGIFGIEKNDGWLSNVDFGRAAVLVRRLGERR
jgi:hypothetical protein